MRLKFRIQENSGPEIELNISPWTGTIKVYVDGEEAEKLKEKGRPFLIRMNDGSIKKLFIKGYSLDLLPKVFIDDKEILIAKKLAWYERFLVWIPLFLIFRGGAIGGALGVIGSIINFKIIRSKQHILLRILETLFVTFLAIICFVIVAIFLRALIFRK